MWPSANVEFFIVPNPLLAIRFLRQAESLLNEVQLTPHLHVLVQHYFLIEVILSPLPLLLCMDRFTQSARNYMHMVLRRQYIVVVECYGVGGGNKMGLLG